MALIGLLVSVRENGGEPVPHVWAATFSLHLDKGEGTAIATADAAAGVVKKG
ncbi:hypothetical protein VC253_21795 [Xanthomonas campestris]|nr:hypothetical protein [Xanthomonas campestris]